MFLNRRAARASKQQLGRGRGCVGASPRLAWTRKFLAAVLQQEAAPLTPGAGRDIKQLTERLVMLENTSDNLDWQEPIPTLTLSGRSNAAPMAGSGSVCRRLGRPRKVNNISEIVCLGPAGLSNIIAIFPHASNQSRNKHTHKRRLGFDLVFALSHLHPGVSLRQLILNLNRFNEHCNTSMSTIAQYYTAPLCCVSQFIIAQLQPVLNCTVHHGFCCVLLSSCCICFSGTASTVSS